MLGGEKELGTRVECVARIPISQNASKTVIVIGAAFVAANVDGYSFNVARGQLARRRGGQSESGTDCN
jgi:hypothetical protein